MSCLLPIKPYLGRSNRAAYSFGEVVKAIRKFNELNSSYSRINRVGQEDDSIKNTPHSQVAIIQKFVAAQTQLSQQIASLVQPNRAASRKCFRCHKDNHKDTLLETTLKRGKKTTRFNRTKPGSWLIQRTKSIQGKLEPTLTAYFMTTKLSLRKIVVAQIQQLQPQCLLSLDPSCYTMPERMKGRRISADSM